MAPGIAPARPKTLSASTLSRHTVDSEHLAAGGSIRAGPGRVNARAEVHRTDRQFTGPRV